MKKIFSAILLAAMVVFPAKVLAYAVPVSNLNEIVGNWYDVNGNLIFTISSDYKINGYDIAAVDFEGDTAGFYKIFINDGRYVEVTHTGSAESKVHDMLIVDSVALRRTENPQYFESIGGIYLGMDANEVLSIYGNPSSGENFNRFLKDWIWKYDSLGLEVSIYAGVVTEVKMYSYGDRRLDRSGLSANNSTTDFGYKYNTSVSRRGNLNIGYGELLHIDGNSVTLGIFTAGYVF